MSVRPIDLQTMFMRMAELSKEQAAAQEAVAHRQAAQDAQLARLGKEKNETVSKPEEIPEGPDKIGKDDDGTVDSRRRKKQRNPDADSSEVKDSSETVNSELKDPLLGTNIDISG